MLQKLSIETRSFIRVILIDLAVVLILVNYILKNSLLEIKPKHSSIIFLTLLIVLLVNYFNYLSYFIKSILKNRNKKVGIWEVVINIFINLFAVISIIILGYITIIFSLLAWVYFIN